MDAAPGDRTHAAPDSPGDRTHAGPGSPGDRTYAGADSPGDSTPVPMVRPYVPREAPYYLPEPAPSRPPARRTHPSPLDGPAFADGAISHLGHQSFEPLDHPSYVDDPLGPADRLTHANPGAEDVVLLDETTLADGPSAPWDVLSDPAPAMPYTEAGPGDARDDTHQLLDLASDAWDDQDTPRDDPSGNPTRQAIGDAAWDGTRPTADTDATDRDAADWDVTDRDAAERAAADAARRRTLRRAALVAGAVVAGTCAATFVIGSQTSCTARTCTAAEASRPSGLTIPSGDGRPTTGSTAPSASTSAKAVAPDSTAPSVTPTPAATATPDAGRRSTARPTPQRTTTNPVPSSNPTTISDAPTTNPSPRPSAATTTTAPPQPSPPPPTRSNPLGKFVDWLF
ncbi:hypothetical protein J5X84_29290 [Streptosporangiaceae bacterium NEAU-GS5]|nr:hypothetical protein [Streptosporangiaceae bacterium NEAU-GS5]